MNIKIGSIELSDWIAPVGEAICYRKNIMDENIIITIIMHPFPNNNFFYINFYSPMNYLHNFYVDNLRVGALEDIKNEIDILLLKIDKIKAFI